MAGRACGNRLLQRLILWHHMCVITSEGLSSPLALFYLKRCVDRLNMLIDKQTEMTCHLHSSWLQVLGYSIPVEKIDEKERHMDT